MDRRTFISLSTLLPFFGLKKLLANRNHNFLNETFVAKMTRDPNKIVDLHPQLQYKIISEAGSIMSDGYKVPALADGMGSFNVDGNNVLVRNHELDIRNGMKKVLLVIHSNRSKN